MTTLDLGALVGRVALETVQFDRTYVRVVRQMSDLGVKASVAAERTEKLDASLTDTAAAGSAAATGLGRASQALTEAGISASRTAAATTEAGLASSRLTQATLRQQAAQSRLSELQATGTASTRQLAGAQATLIAANDRVALSEERVGQSMVLGARSADRMRSAWSAIPGPVKVGAAALAIGAVEALKAASNYQKLTVNLVTGAGESQRNLKMVGDGMLHMAGQVGDSADALAKAMFLVESAGFHGAAALTLLKTAAEGAKVDNADLTTVVDALTSAMNAYHEPAAKAAMVTNTLIASAAVGKMHLQDLAASLGTVLPSAAALRVPLDQVGAALATMTMQGTNADRAATYLRFAFAALANPTSKAQKAMEAVGLTSERVATTMTHGGLPAVFTLLETAVGQKFPIGSAKYLAALANMVGGTRGLQAVLELTGKNLTTMSANLDSIQGRVKGAGNSVSDWADIQKNLNQQWSEFIDGLGAAGIKIGQDVVPAATDLLKVLNTTGHVVGDVTGFFDHDRTAANALAVVLLMTLEPALSRVALAAGTAMKALAVGRIGAAGTALKGLGVAGLAGRVGVAAVALEALNAVGDLRHLHDTVNGLNRTLEKPLTGSSMFKDLASEQNAISAAFDKANHTGSNFFENMGAWAAHPVQTFNDAIGKTDEGIKATQVQLDNAYGGFRDLVMAMHKWPTPDAENQTAMVIKAMGLSATDLATHNFPALLASVRQWTVANKASHDPAAQAHTDIVALGSGALSAADEVKALTAALDLFAGNAISADQGAIAFRNDIRSLDKALKDSHGSLTLNTQAGRDARDAFDSAAQQALNTAEAQAKLKDGTDKARTTLQQEIQTLKDHAGGSDYARQAIDRLTKALHNLPGATDGRKQGENFGAGYAQGIRQSQLLVDAAASDLALAAKAATQRTQDSHSPSRVAKALGQDFGAGLAQGLEGSDKQVSAAATRLAQRAVDAVQAAVQAARSQLSNDLQARGQTAGGIASNLLGPLDLSNAVINGRVGNLSAFLKAGSGPLHRLHHEERLLRDAGLSPKLLAQIANAPVGSGIALATNILSGQSGSIAHLDHLARQARIAARGIGGLVADQMYDPRIAADRKDVHDSLLELQKIHAVLHEVKQVIKQNPTDLAGALDQVVSGLDHKRHARAGSR